MIHIRQFSKREFTDILRRNGFNYKISGKGSHNKYINEYGATIVVPKTIKSVVALRLIKEYKLEV